MKEQFDAAPASPRQRESLAAEHAQQELVNVYMHRVFECGRLFTMALSLVGAQSGIAHAEPGNPLDADTAAIIDMRESTGTLKLADGTQVMIPNSNGPFGTVSVYSPKGRAPDKLIIWFGQTHANRAAAASPDPHVRHKHFAELIQSQEAAYDELYRLHTQKVIRKLCIEEAVEGSGTAGMEANYRVMFPELVWTTASSYLPEHPVAQLVSRRTKALAAPELSAESVQELTTEIEPTLKLYVEQFKYAAGAKTLLAATTSIKLCAASTRSTFDAAFTPEVIALASKSLKDRTAEEQSHLHTVVMVDREDAAVERAAAEGDKVIAVQYGALHFPLQSIIKWNSAHPASQFGLVFVPDAAMKGMPPIENVYAAPK